MTGPTVKALAAEQAHLKRRIDAQAVQIRHQRNLIQELAQRLEALWLVVDAAASPAGPQTPYERAAAAQADERADREARRRIIYAVPSQEVS